MPNAKIAAIITEFIISALSSVKQELLRKREAKLSVRLTGTDKNAFLYFTLFLLRKYILKISPIRYTARETRRIP